MRRASGIIDWIDGGHLPAAVRAHGIMPELAPEPGGNYWGGPDAPEKVEQLRGGTCALWLRTTEERGTAALRRIAHTLKGEAPQTTELDLGNLGDLDSQRLAVYTDGTVTHPAWPQYALGGGASRMA